MSGANELAGTMSDLLVAWALAKVSGKSALSYIIKEKLILSHVFLLPCTMHVLTTLQTEFCEISAKLPEKAEKTVISLLPETKTFMKMFHCTRRMKFCLTFFYQIAKKNSNNVRMWWDKFLHFQRKLFSSELLLQTFECSSANCAGILLQEVKKTSLNFW